jgi:hypothetical protein
MEMAGKLAPGPQTCRGYNAGFGVLYHVARIDGLPSGLPTPGWAAGALRRCAVWRAGAPSMMPAS